MLIDNNIAVPICVRNTLEEVKERHKFRFRTKVSPCRFRGIQYIPADSFGYMLTIWTFAGECTEENILCTDIDGMFQGSGIFEVNSVLNDSSDGINHGS